METFYKNREKMLHPKWTRCCSLSFFFSLCCMNLELLSVGQNAKICDIRDILRNSRIKKQRFCTSWTSWVARFFFLLFPIISSSIWEHRPWKCHWNGERANICLHFFFLHSLVSTLCLSLSLVFRVQTTCKNFFVLISMR